MAVNILDSDWSDVRQDTFSYIKSLEQRLTREASKRMRLYYSDPVAFAHDCITWPEGLSLTEYQEEALAELQAHGRLALRSLHGAGKTTTVAIAVHWFSQTRDALGVDWKIPTTAGVWTQLEQYLWPEIHKWAHHLNYDELGRRPMRRNVELLANNLKLKYGQAFAVASTNAAFIEGAHADSILYVFDESKSILPMTFDAAEGAFSGTGEAFALAASTPGEPVGRFYDVCSHRAGYEDWHSVHVSLERAIEAGRVSPTWAEQRAKQWGIKSALYNNRVLGEFHSADEDGVIPLSWVEAAIRLWHENGKRETPLTKLSVDVARFGDDQTVLGSWQEKRLAELEYHFHEDTMQTSGHVVGKLRKHGCKAVIDADGLGAGVFDRVREQGYDCDPFHGAEATDKLDRAGELGFINVRSAAWWTAREALDPDYASTIELPDDELMTGDLVAPHWKETSRGLIQVESKDDIKKRLGRSPDAGDTVVMGLWERRVRRRARMHYEKVA